MILFPGVVHHAPKQDWDSGLGAVKHSPLLPPVARPWHRVHIGCGSWVPRCQAAARNQPTAASNGRRTSARSWHTSKHTLGGAQDAPHASNSRPRGGCWRRPRPVQYALTVWRCFGSNGWLPTTPTCGTWLAFPGVLPGEEGSSRSGTNAAT